MHKPANKAREIRPPFESTKIATCSKKSPTKMLENKKTKLTFTRVNNAKRLPMPKKAKMISGTLISMYAMEKMRFGLFSIFNPQSENIRAIT